MLRKIQFVGLALVAVSALGAFFASSAFAESKILWNNANINELLPITMTGFLLMEEEGVIGKPDILCSYILDGMIEPGGTLIYIEELLSLDGHLYTLGGVRGFEDMVDCEAGSPCLNNTVLVTVNIDGTNWWHLAITLDSGGQYLADYLTLGQIEELLEPANVISPLYEFLCNTIIGTMTNECEGLYSSRLVNSAEGLLGYFNALALTETWGAESESPNCTLSGVLNRLENEDSTGMTDTEASGYLIADTGGGTLSISE